MSYFVDEGVPLDIIVRSEFLCCARSFDSCPWILPPHASREYESFSRVKSIFLSAPPDFDVVAGTTALSANIAEVFPSGRRLKTRSALATVRAPSRVIYRSNAYKGIFPPPSDDEIGV